MEPQAGPFHVYAFQAAELDENGNPEDVILSYNLGGIRMNETAFRKLQQEITLEALKVRLPASLASSDKGEYRLFSATVPVDRDIFRKMVVRESRIPRIDPADFSVKGWTERSYYEICTDPAIYAALEKAKGASTHKVAGVSLPRCFKHSLLRPFVEIACVAGGGACVTWSY